MHGCAQDEDAYFTHCVAQAVADGGHIADQKIAEASAAVAGLVNS
jgi:hypothetical protein